MGSFPLYGAERLYDGSGEDIAYVTSPFQCVLIYSYGESDYSYTVADPRVYVANQTVGGATRIQVYAFVLSAAVDTVSPAAGELSLTGSVNQEKFTYNVISGGELTLSITVGGKNRTLTLPVSVGGTVEVQANVVNIAVSFLPS
jgi:hypothetical protein